MPDPVRRGAAGGLRRTRRIIPPSIPLILYGVTTQTSVPELFIAGLGTGLLIGGALLSLAVLERRRLNGWGRGDGEGRLGPLAALREAAFALLMPVVVLPA